MTRLLLLIAAVSLNACQTVSQPSMEPVPVMVSHSELQEARLLDVGIEVFQPGPVLSEENQNPVLNQQIRKAEARYISTHLKTTLQQTGYWGAVRVIPEQVVGAELLIQGSILQSDGETLTLHIKATDSAGTSWLDKEYTGSVNLQDYNQQVVEKYDVFQNVYNEIANDLINLKKQKSTGQLTDIRDHAELKFAADLAPRTFNESLKLQVEAVNQQQTLPDIQAPEEMTLRIRMIRERDYMLIDTYNEHYRNYYRDLWEPYTQWRENRLQEQMNLRQIENDALVRKAIGVTAVVGAIALTAVTGVDVGLIQAALLAGGLYAAKTGFDKDNEKQIHVEAIQEMDVSFEAEATPMVIDVDGEVYELTGSVETQYIKWRKLLDEMHFAETESPPNPVQN